MTDINNTKKKVILLYDDDKEFTSMIKEYLEGTKNYEVRVGAMHEDIIAMLRIFKPDVILMDLLMPGYSGLDLCQILNKDPEGMKTPIIVMSGLGKNEDKLKAYKLGIVDYLVKPININHLVTSIEKATQAR